jgi:hypothetical protein
MPKMHQVITPDEAKALVERLGSKAAAARHLGVPWSTFEYWFDPERHRKRLRRYYAKNREWKIQYERDHYDNLSGFQYNRKMFKKRRLEGLQRINERNRRRKKDEAA